MDDLEVMTMNKVYKNIDDFLKEIFPNFSNNKDQNPKTTLQDYMESFSHKFSAEIRKIIKGQDHA